MDKVFIVTLFSVKTGACTHRFQVRNANSKAEAVEKVKNFPWHCIDYNEDETTEDFVNSKFAVDEVLFGEVYQEF